MPWLEDLKFPRGYQMGTHILNSTEWFNTKLKELDFSSCEIENIAVSSDKLTGVVVNSSQALEFVRLLGIVVKD